MLESAPDSSYAITAHDEVDRNSPESSHNSSGNKRKEIYTYEAPWTTYSLAFCRKEDSGRGKFKLAVGSYIEEYTNQIQIIQLQHPDVLYTNQVGISEFGKGNFVKLSQFDHPYTATKVRSLYLITINISDHVGTFIP